MRYASFLTALLLATAIGVCTPGFAGRPPTIADDASTKARLDAVLGGRLAWRSIPGASVALVEADGSRRTWVAGRSLPFAGAPITSQTQFEVASLSKPVTAYAALQLVQQGRLGLDGVITRGGRTFTLRQLLSHTAGFDNALSGTPRPTSEPGRFRYAGSGYLVVAEEIERVTGVGFAEHMNRSVLPGLGMAHSSFGPATDPRIALARPSLDLAVPALAASLIAFVVGVPLLRVALPRAAFAISLLAGLGALVGALGVANLPVVVAVAGVLGAAGAAAALGASRSAPRRLVALGLALVLVFVLVARPAIPLAPRKPAFLPAAGLRTTPDDYARFLQEVLAPRHLDPALAELMRRPAVPADADNDWALGLGVHRRPSAAIWHWGVNYPGYQAFAIAVPETGRIVVVALNGSAIVPRPGGIRHSGLDLARDGVAALGVPMSGSFWEGVQ